MRPNMSANDTKPALDKLRDSTRSTEARLCCANNEEPRPKSALVSPGGVVAFDEYALAGYGESDAVDEFFRGQKIRLCSFPWARTPMAFLVKETA